jgi:type I restriction enzyme R subunit
MMTEYGYVEKPILEWLSGKPTDPEDRGLGWRFRSEAQMAEFNRALDDPLVEGLLLPALLRINRAVKTPAQARLAVDALRRIMATPDSLEANRRTLEALRDGVAVVLTPGEPAVTVKFFAFDPDHQHLNDFTVTNQYSVRGTETVRADTVLLVNGIPLVLAEYKSYVNSGKDWKEGVNQLHRYQREAPALLMANVFAVAADEQEFRYGPVAFQVRSQRDIDLQRDQWRPWLSQYPGRRGYWNLPDDQLAPDPVKAAVDGLLLPCNVLDFLQHFTVFETKKGKTVKKVARYQQFEAANDLVDRVLEHIGQPDVKPQDRTGLIWHTQGSGKSLTMIYAGYKLRRHPKLDNPTVLIVVDRRDLKTQLGDDFENCDYPNVVKALGVRDLRARIEGDRRETVVTTLQCFQQMDDLEPSQRDNTILLIDECHRSQKGKGAGYATTMRVKLPKAFRFGFTGTPIDKTMVNTHRDFGPIKQGKQERYLSYYGIRQAIKDGATLEVHFQFRPVPLAAEQETLDTNFEQVCEEMELEDEEEKDFLQRKEVRWKALARHPLRVAKIVENLVTHFLKHPDPSGFKAQLVCIDRPACAQYKEALDAELNKRGIRDGPVWSEVIISEAQNDPPELERYHYGKEKTDRLIDYFKLTPAEWEKWNRDQFGDDRSKWKPPLKILIVCDRLLTGFDAPVEQVMYLDKPLRDHNLLQAMARTNRPLPEMGKRTGVIVDYFGVFEDLQRALNFDESEVEEAAIDWEKLKEQVPEELGRCMKFFEGIAIEDTRDCLLACLRRLAEEQTAREFEAQFKRTEVLWEAIAPDECLYPHRKSYAFLCTMYIAHRRRNRRVQATHEELAAKTRQLIHDHIDVLDIAENLPVYKIDANYLTHVQNMPSAADKAAELEAALTAELTEGGGGFLYKLLGERLEQILARKDADVAAAQRKLQELEALVREVNAAKTEPERLGLTAPGEWPLYTVVREYAKNKDEGLCVRAAKKLMAELLKKRLLPRGWSTNAGGRKNVSLALQVACWDTELMALDLCPTDLEDPPFLAAAVAELARVIE